MRAPSQVSWATLLFCCTAVSLTTSIAVALAYHQLQKSHSREKGGGGSGRRTPANKTVKKRPAYEETDTDDASVEAEEAKEDERKQEDGPLASLEALLSSVEELISSKEAKSEDDEPASSTDPLLAADAVSSPSNGRQLSAKDLLASVDEILARETKPKTVEKEDDEPLATEDVPEELRIDKYFTPDHIAAFDHKDIFRGHSNVSAVIDAIRPYLEKFFREGAWASAHPHSNNVTILKANGRVNGRYGAESGDSDTDDEDGESVASLDASMTQQWRLPECIDPTDSAEVVLYPGVDSRTFAPEKIINLDPNAVSESTARGTVRSINSRTRQQKKHIVVLPGAMILGGVFDVSEGSIFIGKNARIEHNAYIKGPCIIGDHSTIRSGAYLGGDLIIGNHVLLRGELKNALVMDHTELRHPGYFGDSICGVNRHALGQQDLATAA